MTGEEDDPAVAAARELAQSLQAMTGQLGKLNTRQDRADLRDRRSRRMIAGLIVSISLDVLVTAGLGWNTVRQDDVQNAIRASDIQQCQLTNTARGQDIAIWNRLLKVSATASAAQKAEVADLERLVKAKDTPRDCTAAYRAG